MAVKKDTKVTPVRVPIHNINSFVRIPGRPATTLAEILQTWDGVNPSAPIIADPETPMEKRREYRIYMANELGQSFIPVTEQVYEVALYTRATKRFTDWMKANGKVQG